MAGEFIRTVTEEGSVILATGSQDNVYLEEAVKILCDMTEDRELVRQSEAWMAKKNEFFSQFSEQK
jgi:pyrroloquinoline quinone (PQQ) biosynthesis protein C